MIPVEAAEFIEIMLGVRDVMLNDDAVGDDSVAVIPSSSTSTSPNPNLSAKRVTR